MDNFVELVPSVSTDNAALVAGQIRVMRDSYCVELPEKVVSLRKLLCQNARIHLVADMLMEVRRLRVTIIRVAIIQRILCVARQNNSVAVLAKAILSVLVILVLKEQHFRRHHES
jgi:hypothetical protein